MAPQSSRRASSKDAALVVDVCFSVEEGDVVTIICDDEHADEATPSPTSASSAARWPVVMNNETQVRRGPRGRPLPDGAAGEPPPRDGRLGRDDHHHQPRMGEPLRARDAVRETCEANGKIASVEPGMGAWGLTVEDIERSRRSGRRTRWPRSRARRGCA